LLVTSHFLLIEEEEEVDTVPGIPLLRSDTLSSCCWEWLVPVTDMALFKDAFMLL
jgi:hypothetical protein